MRRRFGRAVEEIAAMTPQLIEVFDATLAKHAQRIDAILIQDDLLGGLRQLEPGAPPRFANGKLLDVAGNVVTNRASLTARWISSLTDRPTRFDTTRSDFQSSPIQ